MIQHKDGKEIAWDFNKWWKPFMKFKKGTVNSHFEKRLITSNGDRYIDYLAIRNNRTIYGFEVKSKNDSTKNLLNQIKTYSEACHYFSVIMDASKIAKMKPELDTWGLRTVGIYLFEEHYSPIVDDTTILFKEIRKPMLTGIDADLLVRSAKRGAHIDFIKGLDNFYYTTDHQLRAGAKALYRTKVEAIKMFNGYW